MDFLFRFLKKKKGDASSPLFFSFALEFAITKVQENKEGLELNETHQFMLIMFNLLGENININKNKEALLNASEEVG
jgi:hypothetical protein